MTFGYNANLVVNPSAGRSHTFALDLLQVLNARRRTPDEACTSLLREHLLESRANCYSNGGLSSLSRTAWAALWLRR